MTDEDKKTEATTEEASAKPAVEEVKVEAAK